MTVTSTSNHALELRPGESAPPLVKRAHNAATESENKIHSDEEARRLGLRGGLVPGVTLYAYLTELLLPLLGPDWLRRGASTVRFVRPVYEGEEVTCTATRTDSAAAGVRLNLAVLGPDGTACVVGTAALPAPDDFIVPDSAAWAYAPWVTTATPVGERPPLTRETAPLGLALASRTLTIDADATQAYADEMGDGAAWYRGGSPFGLPLVPPGLLAGQPARIIRQGFSYGPSVHAASEIRHLALPLAGGVYRVDAALLETFAKRGNDYLVADVLVRDHAQTAVVRIRHTSIFNFAPR